MRFIEKLEQAQHVRRVYGEGAADLLEYVQRIILASAQSGRGFLVQGFAGRDAELIRSDFALYLAQQTGCAFDIRPGHDDSTVRVLIDLPEGE